VTKKQERNSCTSSKRRAKTCITVSGILLLNSFQINVSPPLTKKERNRYDYQSREENRPNEAERYVL
jgi:hypothetical protein